MNKDFKLDYIPLSMVQEEKIDYILTGDLPMPKNALSMISAKGGMGKSFYTLKMAMRHINQTGESVVVWYSEDRASQVLSRVNTLVADGERDFDRSKLLLITSHPPQLAYKSEGVFRADYEAISKVQEFIAKKEVTFFIIDPLLSFYGGDENDNSQARVFMLPLAKWAEDYEVSILIVHHAGKSDQTRGASAFEDTARCLYTIGMVTDDKGNVNEEAHQDGKRKITLKKENGLASWWLTKSDRSRVFVDKVIPEYRGVE